MLNARLHWTRSEGLQHFATGGLRHFLKINRPTIQKQFCLIDDVKFWLVRVQFKRFGNRIARSKNV